MKNAAFVILSMCVFFTAINTVSAQQDQLKNKSQEEIIIRKQGDSDAKVTVEMKNGDVLINGKPLSEFNDSTVTVIKRNRSLTRSKDLFTMPRGGNSFFYNQAQEEEARAFLGVTTEKEGKGVKINEVVKGSAAEKAGLKEGDIITRLNGKTIGEPNELVEAVRGYKPKNEVKIDFERNGKANNIKAILGEGTGMMKSFSFNSNRMPPLNDDMFKDFNFEMPVMPGQPFKNFRVPQNKRLGVKIEDTENDEGARISNVEQSSAAEKAGLKKDDIITEVDGKKITTAAELKEKVLENEKSTYTLKAKRGGDEMSFEIKIPKKLNSINL